MVKMTEEIDAIDTVRNVRKSSEVLDMQEMNIRPSNRSDLNILLRKQQILIIKN